MTCAAKGITSATLRPVIIRACARCGAPRQQGGACARCGNPDPPEVIDLGIQSAWYSNPLRRLGWLLAGSRLAARRARKANRSA